MSASEGGVLSVHSALGTAFRSVYHNSVATAVVSFVWVVACLPIVTIGPATLGAYAAVQSIRQQGRVDRTAVRSTLARHWHHATLLGAALLLFAGLAIAYVSQYLFTQSTVAGLLGVVALLLTAHLWAVLVVAFVRMADGETASDAVRSGYRWTVDRPTETALLGLVTFGLLLVSIPLTIAVVLIFPVLTFTFHAELVGETRERRR